MVNLRATLVVPMALAIAAIAMPSAAGWAEVREAFEQGDAVRLVAALQPLAENGDAEAQFNLGILYDTGQGVRQDYQEAARWYQMAGDQGHPTALYNLGLLYFEGKGVERDRTVALALYRHSAQNGDSDAFSSIGYMYLYGLGVDEDPVEALAYFLIAAERGSSHGARNRDRVLGDLDTNDFAFARQRSRDLAAEYPLAQ